METNFGILKNKKSPPPFLFLIWRGEFMRHIFHEDIDSNIELMHKFMNKKDQLLKPLL